MSEERKPPDIGFLLAIGGLLLLSIAALLAGFAPLAECPYRTSLHVTSKWECPACDDSNKVTFFRKWKLIRENPWMEW
jgi:hypothetical protein